MWARVKGATENCDSRNAIREHVRVPSILHSSRSTGSYRARTRYRAFYSFWAPFYRVLRAIAPSYVTDYASRRSRHAVRRATRRAALDREDARHQSRSPAARFRDRASAARKANR
jgi:hypothetical protein